MRDETRFDDVIKKVKETQCLSPIQNMEYLNAIWFLSITVVF